MMKFLADENIPLEVVLQLQRNGFDIISLSNMRPRASDEEALSIANKEKRIIITFDTDFGELVFKLKKENKGVILLRIHPQSKEYLIKEIEKVISLDVDFYNSFCVLELNNLRVIPLNN